MNTFVYFTVVAMSSMIGTSLTVEQEAAVRADVYKHTPRLYSPNQDFNSEVEVPRKLVQLYSSHQTETLEILLRIADGASPTEAITAITYAFALVDGPGGGVACIQLFDAGAFDKMDKAWATTPRRHWIAKLREKMKAKQ
jgi:hypothetical protein